MRKRSRKETVFAMFSGPVTYLLLVLSHIQLDIRPAEAGQSRLVECFVTATNSIFSRASNSFSGKHSTVRALTAEEAQLINEIKQNRETLKQEFEARGLSIISTSDEADEIRARTTRHPTLLGKISKISGISGSDPMFSRDYHDTIPVRGRARNFKIALEDIGEAWLRFPNLLATSKGAVFFHGSKSAALLAFTKYGGASGGLIPTGQLESSGRVPFSGEILFGRKGINRNAISTEYIAELGVALSYAGKKSDGWNPGKSDSAVRRVNRAVEQSPPPAAGSMLAEMLGNMNEIAALRQREWNKLNSIERGLVESGFPVLFGLRPKPGRVLTPANSSVPGEVLFVDGVAMDEIRVIYVPEKEKSRVQKIVNGREGLNEPIAIESIELLQLSDSD